MFRAAVAFSSWTVFSFLCHYGAKEFLSSDNGDGLILACMLTLGQLTCCYILLTFTAKAEASNKASSSQWAFVMAVVTHVGATFSTNYSLAVLYAPSTLTIKLMEPLMSAVVVWLVLGKPVATINLLAVLVLIAGSLGFVGNPLTSLSLGGGTVLALISNVLYGLRNVLIKHILQVNMNTCQHAEYVLYALVAVASMWAWNRDAALYLLMLSAGCHVIYSYISTSIILQELSVVGHAVANIAKRLLVVLLMVAVGHKHLEPHKYAWLVVCAVGLCIFAYSKVTAISQGDVVVSKQRQRLTVSSLTSMLLLLLTITCINLARSPIERRGSMDKHIPKDKVIPVGEEHIDVHRRLLDAGSPTWDDLPESIVAQIAPAIRSESNVILSHFPVSKDRAGAMENVGLLYVLKDLNATIIHSKGRKAEVELADVKDPAKGTFVIVAANVAALPVVKVYLASKNVQGVLMFLPSALGKTKALYEDKTFIGWPRDDPKLKFFCHDLPTLKSLQGQGWKNVTLLPSLAFCVPRVYRFLKPLFHFVFQSDTAESVGDGCKHVRGEPPTVRCDSRSWEEKKWVTPRGINEVENVYLRTYIGYLYLLRGQIVIVDELAALVAAMQFDIPTVALTTAAPDMHAYIETWEAHGYNDYLRTAEDQKHAAEAAMDMTEKLRDQLVDFEPGIKIIKSFPR